MKSIPLIILYQASSLSLLAGEASQGAASSARPNVIVILMDDMGYGDIGCYGGVIPTPNIDKLADNGVRMSQMYNCARSCPTRASLLTGLYPQQTGVGCMTNDISKKSSKAYQGYLNENCVTIAEVLKNNGYSTFMAGKWHVGQEHGVTPSTRGFEHSINAPAGGFNNANSPKAELYVDGIKIANDDERLPKKWYSDDVWTQFGKQYIDDASNSKKPFFLYMAYNAPHFPLAAPEEDVKLFKGKFHDGWDKIRKQIYDRQLKMNLFGKDYPLSKRSPLIPLWENVNATQQMKCEMTMEVYAAMIYHVDKCVGEMVAKLKDKGLYENTVILFLSDNGASAEGGTVFGAKEAQLGDKVKAAGMLGQVWAEMSNTPFALYKHNTHEGGISTPFIVSYPSGIPKNQNGKIVHQYGHVVDIMATIVGICGAKYPTNYNGNEIIPMQGINLLPVLKGEKVKRKEPIVWEHTGNIALRDGKWKIVKERQDTEFELYDMENDRTEMNNLALKKPEILMEMKKKMEAKSQSVGIMAIDFGEIPRWYVPVTKY